MEHIICNTPEKMTEYRKACRAERMAEIQPRPKAVGLLHDKELPGCVVFVCKELLGFRLTKAELLKLAMR